MRKIKEIALNVDTSRVSSPHVKGKQSYYIGNSGGMNDSATSSYSSYMNSKKFPVEEEEEFEEESDIMPENILNLRVRREKGYSLSETLKLVEELDFIDTAAAAMKYGARAVNSAAKSAILSIPFVDTIAGSMMLISGMRSFKMVSDIIIEKIKVPENTFSEAMSSESEESWQEIINVVANLDEKDRAELEEHFEDLLHNIKTFITTLFQAYDSVFASAGAVGGPVGLAAAEGATNISTAVIGFVADTVPWERFVVDVAGKSAGLIEEMFEFFLGQSSGDEDLSDAIEDAGPVFMSILKHPIRSISRLGQFYTAIETGSSPSSDVASAALKNVVDDPGRLSSIIDAAIKSQLGESTYYGIDEDSEEIDMHHLLSSLEEKEVEEQEVEEHAVGGYAAPLAGSKKDLENNMRIKEELQKLQDWKLKTAGRTRHF